MSLQINSNEEEFDLSTKTVYDVNTLDGAIRQAGEKEGEKSVAETLVGAIQDMFAKESMEDKDRINLIKVVGNILNHKKDKAASVSVNVNSNGSQTEEKLSFDFDEENED